MIEQRQIFLVLAVSSLVLIFWAQYAYPCNEQVCASIVSKCMLTQSCKCDLKVNCSCCKECFDCLGHLYSECCSCVEMCPKPNDTNNPLSMKSHVEDLEPIVDLYNALTDGDSSDVMTIFRFPEDYDRALYGAKSDKDIKMFMHSVDQGLDIEAKAKADVITVQCTVAYMAHCFSWKKCKVQCESMGAASYRWFHDGCCECVGPSCRRYGISESKCKHCPETDEDKIEDDKLDEQETEYGESINPI